MFIGEVKQKEKEIFEKIKLKNKKREEHLTECRKLQIDIDDLEDTRKKIWARYHMEEKVKKS